MLFFQSFQIILWLDNILITFLILLLIFLLQYLTTFIETCIFLAFFHNNVRPSKDKFVYYFLILIIFILNFWSNFNVFTWWVISIAIALHTLHFFKNLKEIRFFSKEILNIDILVILKDPFLIAFFTVIVEFKPIFIVYLDIFYCLDYIIIVIKSAFKFEFSFIYTIIIAKVIWLIRAWIVVNDILKLF